MLHYWDEILHGLTQISKGGVDMAFWQFCSDFAMLSIYTYLSFSLFSITWVYSR